MRRRWAGALAISSLIGLVGARQAAAQCTSCFPSGNQPTTSTMGNSTGSYVPTARSPYSGSSTGTYGVGGSALAPGQTMPTVGGASIGIGQYGTFLDTGSSDARLGISGRRTASLSIGDYEDGPSPRMFGEVGGLNLAVSSARILPPGTVTVDPAPGVGGAHYLPAMSVFPSTPGRDGAPAPVAPASWQVDPMAPTRQ